MTLAYSKKEINMDKDNNNLSDLPEGNLETEDLINDIESQGNNPPDKPQDKQEKPNSFPFDIFPLKLQELIKGAKNALGMPPGFLASATLFAVSVAGGATYKLEVKKKVEQMAILFMVLIGNPNTNKSRALDFALKPIIERDNSEYEIYKTNLAEYETVKEMTKKERQDNGYNEIPDRPIYIRHLIADFTLEAVAGIHEDNPRGIAAYRDELAGFVKAFNRYNQGGEQEAYLQLWSGIPIVVDRQTKGTQRIKKPFIGIAGTIQPAVLEEMGKGKRTENGFIDRFLFAWPEGLKKPKWTEEEISLSLFQAYQEALNKLLDLTFDKDNNSHKLTLSPAAKKTLFNFFNEDNKKLCDKAKNELLQGIYGKFDFHAIRLTIVIHLLDWTYSSEEEPPNQVEEETVKKAIKVATFFRDEAKKVYNALHDSNPVEKLPKDRRDVYNALPDKFETKEGEAIAEAKGMKARTFRHFLATNKGILFDKIEHGKYSKLY